MEVDNRQTVHSFSFPPVVLPQGWGGNFFKAAKKAHSLRSSIFLRPRSHPEFPQASSSGSREQFSADSLDQSQQFYSGLASQEFSQEFLQQTASQEGVELQPEERSESTSASASHPAGNEPVAALDHESSFKTRTRIDAVFPLSPCQGCNDEEEGESTYESVEQRFLISSPGHGNSYLSTVEESPDIRGSTACRLSRPDSQQFVAPSGLGHNQQGNVGTRFCLSPARLLSLASNSPTGNRSFKTIDIPFPVISPKKAFGSSPARQRTVVSHKNQEAELPVSQGLVSLNAQGTNPLEGQEADEPEESRACSQSNRPDQQRYRDHDPEQGGTADSAKPAPQGKSGRAIERTELRDVNSGAVSGICQPESARSSPSRLGSVMKVFSRKPNSRSGSGFTDGGISTSNRSSFSSKNDDFCARSESLRLSSKLMGGSIDSVTKLIEDQVREQLYGHGHGNSVSSSGPLLVGQPSSTTSARGRLRVSTKVVSSSCMGLSSIRKMVKSNGNATGRSGLFDRSCMSSSRLEGQVGNLSSRFSSAILSVARGQHGPASKKKAAFPDSASPDAACKGDMKDKLLQRDKGHQSSDAGAMVVDNGKQESISRSPSQRYRSGASKGPDWSHSRGSTGSNWKLESIGNFLEEDQMREENVKHSKRWVDCDIEQIKSEIFMARADQPRSRSMDRKPVDDFGCGNESGWDAAKQADVMKAPVLKKNASHPTAMLNHVDGWACGNDNMSSTSSSATGESHPGVITPVSDRRHGQPQVVPRSLSLDRSTRGRHGRTSPVFTLKSDHLDLEDLMKESPKFKLPQANNNVKDRVAYDADSQYGSIATPVVSSGCSAKALAMFIPNSASDSLSATKKPLFSSAPAAAISKQVNGPMSSAAPERVHQRNGNRDLCGYTSGSRTSSVDVSIHLASSEHIISEKHQLRQQSVTGASRGRDARPPLPPQNASISSTAPPTWDKLPSSSTTSEDSSLFTSFEVDNPISAKKNFLSDYVFSGFRGKVTRHGPCVADRMMTGNSDSRSIGVEVPKQINNGSTVVNTPNQDDRMDETLDVKQCVEVPNPKSFICSEAAVTQEPTKPNSRPSAEVKLPSLLSPSLQERLEEFLSVQLHLSETGRELVKVLKLTTAREFPSALETDAEQTSLHRDEKVAVSATEGNNPKSKDPAWQEDKRVTVEAKEAILDKSTRDSQLVVCEYPNEQLNCYLERQVPSTPQKFNILSNCSTDFEDLQSVEGEGVVVLGGQDDEGHDVLGRANTKDIRIEKVVEGVAATSLRERQKPNRGCDDGRRRLEARLEKKGRKGYSGAESSDFSDRARSSSPARSTWSSGSHHEAAKFVAQRKREYVVSKLPPSQRTRKTREGGGRRSSEYYNTYLDQSSSEASTPRVDSWQRRGPSAPRGKESSRMVKHSHSLNKKSWDATANKGRQAVEVSSPVAKRSQSPRDRSSSYGRSDSNKETTHRKKSCKDTVMVEQKLVDLPSSIQTQKVRESVPVMKTTLDPYQDFRTSMIAMIVEKSITEPCELEELLQAYLTLNAAEYHHLIVAVFSEVWHQLFDDISG